MAQAQVRTGFKQLEGEWEVDPAHSNVGFAVKHMVFTTVRGGFKDFSATFRIEPGGAGHVEATISAASINTNHSDRDAHLRSPDFLDAERYPHIEFRSTDPEMLSENTARLTGELTIRGVTRPATLEVTFNGFLPKDAFGSPRASFSLHGTINRKDFGLTWNRSLETGGVLVGEEITFEIEVAAVRK